MDDQLDLLRYWRGEGGARTGAGFARSMAKVAREEGEDEQQAGVIGDHLHHLVVDALANADPFYVDPELMELVEASAETFQPEPLHETDLPTLNAFVVLPSPLSMIDRKGRKVCFRAFAWRAMLFQDPEKGTKDNGVMVYLFSHLDDRDDVPPPDGWEDETWRDVVWAEQGSPYTLAHVTPWVFGRDVPRDDERDPLRASWWGPVQAFLRLALQTLTTRDQMRPARPARKRWQRERLKDSGYVTVVRLRRPRSPRPDEEERSVDWSHRWIVSGHWRKQWFPSLNTHRQVWIASHVKGPEDKPLLIRRGRAFELVR
jgi:hypothetical protein